jgi:prepilin-type N-terminal cleavage/methylation domain-containing protein
VSILAGYSQTQRKPRAFTLIELLVVITIISMLAGLLFPVIDVIRDHVREARTQALIQSMSMALDTYQLKYNAYPPDRHPQLDKSTECLVYYLSGNSIRYTPGVSHSAYRWTHDLYDTTRGGAGRRNITRYRSFDSSLLVDTDGDGAPELADAWGKLFVYNSGPTADSDTNQNGAPYHNSDTTDLLSAGSDGKYGTKDDLTNWTDELSDNYATFN